MLLPETREAVDKILALMDASDYDDSVDVHAEIEDELESFADEYDEIGSYIEEWYAANWTEPEDEDEE